MRDFGGQTGRAEKKRKQTFVVEFMNTIFWGKKKGKKKGKGKLLKIAYCDLIKREIKLGILIWSWIKNRTHCVKRVGLWTVGL